MADPWERPSFADGSIIIRLQSRIKAMNTYVSRIEQYSNDLGTQKDTKELRQRLEKGRNETKQLCIDIKNILSEKDLIPKNEQITFKKLIESFQEIKIKYDEVRERSMKKEKEIVVQIENTLNENSKNPLEQSSFINIPSVMDGLSSIDDVDQEILKERNNELSRIEKDMNEITDMFSDINIMLNQQGEDLDKVDTEIEQAHDQVKQGSKDVKKAQYYDCKRRCCCIWCCISCCIKDPDS